MSGSEECKWWTEQMWLLLHPHPVDSLRQHVNCPSQLPLFAYLPGSLSLAPQGNLFNPPTGYCKCQGCYTPSNNPQPMKDRYQRISTTTSLSLIEVNPGAYFIWFLKRSPGGLNTVVHSDKSLITAPCISFANFPTSLSLLPYFYSLG